MWHKATLRENYATDSGKNIALTAICFYLSDNGLLWEEWSFLTHENLYVQVISVQFFIQQFRKHRKFPCGI